MTKIQNPTKCPYCAVQLTAVQTNKGFYFVCDQCPTVPKLDNLNLSGGKRQAPDQINDTRTKQYFYV